MAKGTIYKTNGTTEEVEINTLEDMQKAVGGLIEPFYRENMVEGFDYYANEEGLLIGLPVNPWFDEIVGNVIKVESEMEEEEEY